MRSEGRMSEQKYFLCKSLIDRRNKKMGAPVVSRLEKSIT